MTKKPISPAFMSVQDVAAYFNCGVSTVWRWSKVGDLPKPIKIGGSTRWRRADIEAIYSNDVA
ncbi:helix-turn-helix transcriptional regulator [Pseudooceanicola sp.]|uniref:helix-turn-helix transcriptional regulator n=1 Tax=Pseudooceanicola sp. TaxID=1914328 RepID=UPI0035C6AA83